MSTDTHRPFLLVFHYIGIQSYFYWSIGWYDTVSHLLGGIIIGLFTMLFSVGSNFSKKVSFWRSLLMALGVVVLWEFFEFETGITYLSSKYVIDTLFDMLSGLVGAIISVGISLLFFKDRV